MPAPITTLLIDGSFEELSDELALYLDDLKTKQGDDSSNIRGDISSLLQKDQKDEVLKKLVSGSVVLNSAPEKDFVPAYNLLIHLVNQSSDVDTFLPRICGNLSNPITSSSSNGTGLALSVLATVFNTIAQDDDTRYHVFLAILKIVRNSSSFEVLKPQLTSLERWINEWETDKEDQKKLYLAIAEVAEEAGERDQAYVYLGKTLRTIPVSSAGSQEVRSLSTRALKSALVHPSHFDFQDLIALDAVQALRKSDPVLFELLEIFSSQQLDDFSDFKEEHDGFIDKEGLEEEILVRKMRLLTLASLAASTQSRSLPYLQISRALKVAEDEVELWVIDVIRAGLVEGKLSQLNQTFLIHRSTYRVFGEKQWTEVSHRLDNWRNSLEGVLAVVKQEREKMIREKERELKDVEGRLAGSGGGQGSRRTNREIEINSGD